MTRRYDLDWVRVCAFGLLVLYHVGMYYVSWDWHVNSPSPVVALEPLMMLTAPWRLSLLFLVSGVATAFLLAKSQRPVASGTPAGFVGPRSWRLLVPLAFGMLVIVVPQACYEVVEQLPGGYHDGYLAFWARYLAADQTFCDAGGCLVLPTWNHLWFVAYLWVYTMVAWLLARVAPGALAAAGTRLSRWAEGPGLLLWPCAYLALARLLLIGHFGSTHALVDDGYNHAQYLAVFLLGFVVARQSRVWEAFTRLRWTALWLWLASWGVIAGYFWLWRDPPPPDALRLAMRIAWAANQWAAIVAILGFARRLAPGDSPALRYLSQAIFPVYILHQTLIVVLAHHLRPLAMPQAAEGALLVGATFALSFAAYELIRRIRPLRPLFGLPWRAPPPRREVPAFDRGTERGAS